MPDRTADEIAVVLQGLLGQSALVKDADISGIALCSTVPSVLHEIREMCRRYYGDVTTVIVEPGVKTGVPIRVDNPKEVGSDRIMNALAAVHLYGGPAIVVDFGTSTNFDVISANGRVHRRGPRARHRDSVDALSRRAAQLLKVELARPHRVIGRNTVESLQSGIIYAFAGQVEGLVTRIARDLAPDEPGSVTVIATGGLAPLVLDEVEGGGRLRAVAHPDRAPARLRAERRRRLTGVIPVLAPGRDRYPLAGDGRHRPARADARAPGQARPDPRRRR